MHSCNVKEDTLSSLSVAHQLPDHLQNRLLITPVEAGACVGWAKQTVYNKLHDDVFPIPLVEFNGRKMVRVGDLARYIDGLEPNASAQLSRRLGRPTKIESIHAKSKKMGVAA